MPARRATELTIEEMETYTGVRFMGSRAIQFREENNSKSD